MSVRKHMLGLLLATGSTIAQAEPPPPILGLVLGTPLTLDGCPKPGPGVIFPSPCAAYLKASSIAGSPQLLDHYAVHVAISEKPPWATDITVAVAQGVIVLIEVSTMGAPVQDEAAREIVHKLGSPSLRGERVWRTRAGGTLRSPALQWRHGDWVAMFEGVSGDPAFGVLVVRQPFEKAKPSTGRL